MADFAGGGMLAVIGIAAALIERNTSGLGQHIDAAMVDGVISMMTVWYPAWGTSTLRSRGAGLAAGSEPFYRSYRCRDGRFVAVGAVEPQFFAALWQGLGFDGEVPDHQDPREWERLRVAFERRFSDLSRDEWVDHFEGANACVSSVLDPDEVWDHPHIRHRHPGGSATSTPAVPLFSRTPAATGELDLCDRTAEVLAAAGLRNDEIAEVARAAAAAERPTMTWPPKPR